MPPIIVDALTRPAEVSRLSDADWDILIRQGREAGLLARLAAELDAANVWPHIPSQPRLHLESAAIFAAKQQLDIRNEIARVKAAVAEAGADTVLLKGAAYVAAELPAARGRTFQDIDILVPEPKLMDVESALQRHGWRRGELSHHDERYYYEWMHQIPPLTHTRRGSVIDVHHNIVPRTAAARVPSGELLRCAVAIPGQPDLKRLAVDDLILHSAVHLFNEGEFGRSLRDLSDLHYLFQYALQQDAQLDNLYERATNLDLVPPLIYASRLAKEFFGTALPDREQHTRSFAVGTRLVTACFRTAICPSVAGQDFRIRSARSLLYMRSHLLKMPLRILIPHLLTKAWGHWNPAPRAR